MRTYDDTFGGTKIYPGKVRAPGCGLRFTTQPLWRFLASRAGS